MRLNSLGISFQRHFELTGNVGDLAKAISIEQRAIQLTPDGHPYMPGRLNNLGNSYRSRFKCTGNLSDIHTAISTFRKSAISFGAATTRIFAAQQWAELSMIHHPPDSLTAYGIAIDLVSEIAGIDRTIRQRHTDLIEISSLTTSAASAAFTLGDVEKALEWLEQGRCLVWSQLNQLRTPLDHLRAHDKDLAQEFSDISRKLEASGSRRGYEDLNTDATILEKISLQDEAQLHIKISREWRVLLEKIRHIPQFHNFLRPPQTSDLLKHLPHNGVVVMVNVHKARCDALLLISGSDAPIHIPLDFTYDKASKLRAHMHHFLSSYGIRMRHTDRAIRPAPKAGADTQNEIHFVLKVLWLRVVKPILDDLAFSVGDSQFVTYHFVDNFVSDS